VNETRGELPSTDRWQAEPDELLQDGLDTSRMFLHASLTKLRIANAVVEQRRVVLPIDVKCRVGNFVLTPRGIVMPATPNGSRPGYR
jgi:hypothetical protein